MDAMMDTGSYGGRRGGRGRGRGRGGRGGRGRGGGNSGDRGGSGYGGYTDSASSSRSWKVFALIVRLAPWQPEGGVQILLRRESSGSNATWGLPGGPIPSSEGAVNPSEVDLQTALAALLDSQCGGGFPSGLPLFIPMSCKRDDRHKIAHQSLLLSMATAAGAGGWDEWIPGASAALSPSPSASSFSDDSQVVRLNQCEYSPVGDFVWVDLEQLIEQSNARDKSRCGVHMGVLSFFSYKGREIWREMETELEFSSVRPMCRSFADKRHCKFGEKCRYLHPTICSHWQRSSNPNSNNSNSTASIGGCRSGRLCPHLHAGRIGSPTPNLELQQRCRVLTDLPPLRSNASGPGMCDAVVGIAISGTAGGGGGPHLFVGFADRIHWYRWNAGTWSPAAMDTIPVQRPVGPLRVLSTGGAWMFAGLPSGDIAALHIESGQTLQLSGGHSAAVSVVVVANESLVLSGADDGQICWWKASSPTAFECVGRVTIPVAQGRENTGGEVRLGSAGGGSSALQQLIVLSASNSVVAVTCGGHLYAYELSSGTQQWHIDALEAQRTHFKRSPRHVEDALRLSGAVALPSSHLVCASMDGEFRVLNTADGQPIHHSHAHRPLHRTHRHLRTMGPNAQVLLATSGRWLLTWVLPAFEYYGAFRMPAEITCVTETPSPTTVAVGCADGHVRMVEFLS